MPPAICAAMYPTGFRRVCAFAATMQSVTAGFRCAPEMGPKMSKMATSAAGRDRVGEERHGAIPGEPLRHDARAITAATRSAVPSASTAIGDRRGSLTTRTSRPS